MRSHEWRTNKRHGKENIQFFCHMTATIVVQRRRDVVENCTVVRHSGC
jgi:hypothetical protein